VPKKAVIIEDDPDIRELVERTLDKAGFQFFSAGDGQSGLVLIQKKHPALIVLDIMLPGLSGFEICRRIKADPRLAQIPLIMLTARAEESDVLLGLGLGADDYITKPFSPKELSARLSNISKRGPLLHDRGSSTLCCGALAINPVTFEVYVEDNKVNLTATEFRLLETLAGNPNRVFSRDQLLDASISEHACVIDRNIDVHIRSIRKKLGSTATSIETVRGIGYRFSFRPDKE
jgi:two-component system, OmpR family, alkaline phosphatase synthesis response regulator PhoP